MKRLTILVAVLAVLVGAPAAFASGTDTGSMAVSASVASSCTIDSVGALGFGAYTGSALNTSADVKVTCVASDADATLALDDGQNDDGSIRRMKYAGTIDHFLTYSLAAGSSGGTCWGSAVVCTSAHDEAVSQDGSQQTLTVYGTVAASQSLYVGSYTDTVVATVTF